MTARGTGEWVSALFESGKAREVSASAIAVYCYLAYRQGSHASAWPEIRRIAQDVGMSKTTVARTLQELFRAGLIGKEVAWTRGSVQALQYRIVTVPKSGTVEPAPEAGFSSTVPDSGTVASNPTREAPSTVPESGTVNRNGGGTLLDSVPESGTVPEVTVSESGTVPYQNLVPPPSHTLPPLNPITEPDQEEQKDPRSGAPPHPPGEDLSVPPKSKKKRKAKRYTYTPEFEEFWRAYPRPVEKREAFECWNVRLEESLDDGTPITPSILIEAARRYAEECRSKGTQERYIKHPSTFLGPKHPFADYLHSLPSGLPRVPRWLLAHPELVPEEEDRREREPGH